MFSPGLQCATCSCERMAGTRLTCLVVPYTASKETACTYQLSWTTAGTIASSTVSDILQQYCPLAADLLVLVLPRQPRSQARVLVGVCDDGVEAISNDVQL